ncbi:MAG: AAA family ATPase [Clostridiales bacterium 43-6]|nr:MAG: AAA family ATPase [Clostridiales bacterium 43-6]
MKTEDFFPILIRAGLDNDSNTIRAVATKVIRKIKDSNPDIAHQISDALKYNGAGLSSARAIDYFPSPQDVESKMDLLIIKEPIEIETPIFNDNIYKTINVIIDERNNFSKLMALGLKPTSSILLYGEPGVGKTMLAQYLSSVFNLKFATLNMASAVSSYLGKTGQNLKKVLDYAKSEPTLLLLDEFDAIAKKRDDSSDLGELKRVVNVLLKELEDWPAHSIVVAATNHSELLDRAIWRRFDVIVEIPLPDEITRENLYYSLFKEDLYKNEITPLIKAISILSNNMTPADIEKAVSKSKKNSLMYNNSIKKALVIEIAKMNQGTSLEFNKRFCKLAKSELNMTYREMAEILGKSVSAIQNYLKGGTENE